MQLAAALSLISKNGVNICHVLGKHPSVISGPVDRPLLRAHSLCLNTVTVQDTTVRRRSVAVPILNCPVCLSQIRRRHGISPVWKSRWCNELKLPQISSN